MVRGAQCPRRGGGGQASVLDGPYSRTCLTEVEFGPTLANDRVKGTLRYMAQSSERLEQLVRELAQLDSVDQSRVVARAARLRMRSERPSKLTIPTLRGGSKWIGGDVSREAIYGDDGR